MPWIHPTRRERDDDERAGRAGAGDVRRRTPCRRSGARSGTSWTRSAPTTTRQREKRYALTMFPYPSGDLHMGHAEVIALHDVVARYWWQQGYEVLNPMGWDSFGLPAENAAIRNNAHPATYTYANIETQRESFDDYACRFDWSRTLQHLRPGVLPLDAVAVPEVPRAAAWPTARTARSTGAPTTRPCWPTSRSSTACCERCGAEVTKRELTQWYFKITDYAQELLDDLDDLAPTWPERVITAQRNWIGRSEGAHVDFVVEGREEPLTVYTTRPDTLFGATFMVVAADAALAAELVTDEQRPAFEAYRRRSARPPRSTGWPPTGPRPASSWACTPTNPLTGSRIPVYAADYVLADYGTGAIMAVPGQDQRDWEFADGLRPADRPHRRAAGRLGGRGVHRRGPGDQLRQRRDRPVRHGRRRGQGAPPSPSWSGRAWDAARSTSGCATGCCPASATGARRSRSSTARSAARSPYPTTSCRSSCPSCAAPT